MTAKNKTISAIAAEYGIDNLESRGRDALDFHDVAVWSLQEMLDEAYEAGRKSRPCHECPRRKAEVRESLKSGSALPPTPGFNKLGTAARSAAASRASAFYPFT